MKRTTIFLDEQLLAQAQRRARRDGVSFATLVREALGHYLAQPRDTGTLPSIAGRFGSGASDTADRADELLWTDPHA